MTTEKPWGALPPEVAAVLRPVLPQLAEEVLEAIGREVEVYARPLEGPFGRALREGVERALSRFVDLIERPEVEDLAARRAYVALGRGEYREGRSLDALLGAYRVGARVSWRRIAETGVEAGLEPPVLYRLGEAIFAYIDGLSAESVEGYTEEQSAAAGERQRRRETLVRLLVQDPLAEAAAVRVAAQQVGWSLPRTVAVLVAEAEAGARLAARLGAKAIAAGDEERAIVAIADPDAPGLRAQLERALRRRRAALGPTVPLAQARRSLLRAQLAWKLVPAGGEVTEGVVRADEHLGDLLLAGDEELAAEFSARTLAPFEELRPASRTRLLETLRAWLDLQGRIEPVARALDVHPQTVRYRLAQLREVLGHALDEPGGRFELALALRVQPDAAGSTVTRAV
jgi:PucR-like helix-turn-helix protein